MEIDPGRTALLAVHMQGDVVTPEGAFGGLFAEMVEKAGVIEKAASLIEAARDAGATIAYARVVFTEGHPELDANSPIWNMVSEVGCLVDGSPGAAIVPQLAPAEGDVVVNHHRNDPTFESSLLDDLRERGISTVVVFGVATNVSVEAVARSLADRRFRVLVVEDACTAATDAAHSASIETLGLLTAGVTSTEEVLAELGVEAAR